MTTIDEDEYRNHIAGLVAEGFRLDPPGYERLTLWTYVLMHLLNARTNFECVRDHALKLGNLGNSLRQQAFFIAGIMAYGRCYATSGHSIPMLNAKKVYEGSEGGMAVHRRLIQLRNTIAAHTDTSDLVRLTLAVKNEPERTIVRHFATSAMPTNEISGFLEAVAHTEHCATIAINKQLDHLQSKVGKAITLD